MGGGYRLRGGAMCLGGPNGMFSMCTGGPGGALGVATGSPATSPLPSGTL